MTKRGIKPATESTKAQGGQGTLCATFSSSHKPMGEQEGLFASLPLSTMGEQGGLFASWSLFPQGERGRLCAEVSPKVLKERGTLCAEVSPKVCRRTGTTPRRVIPLPKVYPRCNIPIPEVYPRCNIPSMLPPMCTTVLHTQHAPYVHNRVYTPSIPP